MRPFNPSSTPPGNGPPGLPGFGQMREASRPGSAPRFPFALEAFSARSPAPFGLAEIIYARRESTTASGLVP